ncbi:MAG: cation:proton antiporter [Acidobacteriia bacterium]|nr:cation:proton antiporter [Terriglobia bacterium]
MVETTHLLLELFLIFAAAKVMGELFERLRQPAVIGEILAGVVLGPYVLAWVAPSQFTSGLAEIGVILLLFTVGLETKPRDLLQVGVLASSVATLGVVVPFITGWLVMRALGNSTLESVFTGTALVATSVGITARVMADMKILGTRVARVILAAAVIDDVLGMLLLAVVSSLSNGRTQIFSLTVVVLEAVAFIGLIVFWGSRVVGRMKPRLDTMAPHNSAFVLAMVACLGLSVAASFIGIAAIIGAFLAGLAIADHREAWAIEGKVQALGEFLVPFFFVVMGLQLNLKTLGDRRILGMALLIVVVAVLTKLIGCGLAALPMGPRDALRVGFGMVPRGEVGIIVALVGLQQGTISDAIYSVVLVMTVVTTLLSPLLLSFVFKGLSKDQASSPGAPSIGAKSL